MIENNPKGTLLECGCRVAVSALPTKTDGYGEILHYCPNHKNYVKKYYR